MYEELSFNGQTKCYTRMLTRHLETEHLIDKAPKLTHKQTFEFFNEFKVFLNENIGFISKRPMGNIIGILVLVPESEAQPTFGEPDSPFGSYLKRKPQFVRCKMG